MTGQKNVFGEPMQPCSDSPLTGFYRDGCCHTGDDDVGVHVVCIAATEEFLRYSKSKGNDLSTPLPEYGFPGVNPGDRWCLCAQRWKEAFDDGKAPKVILSATHEVILDYVDFKDLKSFALDLN